MLRPELLTDDTDMLRGLRESVAAEEQKNPNAFKHDVVGRKAIKDLADMLDMDGKQLITALQKITNNAHEIPVYVEKLKGLLVEQQRIINESSKAFSDLPTEENRNKILDEQARLAMMLETYSDITNISGRLLGTFNKATVEEERAKIMGSLFQTAGDNPVKQNAILHQLANANIEIAKFENPKLTTKFIKRVSNLRIGETLAEISNTCILSGTISHAGNMLGTFGSAAILIPAEAEIAALRNAVGMFFGMKDTGARIGQGLAGFRQVKRDLPRVLARGFQSLREAKTVYMPGEKPLDISFGFDDLLKKTYGFNPLDILNSVREDFKDEEHPELVRLKAAAAAVEKPPLSLIKEINSTRESLMNKEFNKRADDLLNKRKTYADLKNELIEHGQAFTTTIAQGLSDIKTAKWFDVNREGGAIPNFTIAKLPVPLGSAMRGTTSELFSVPHTVLRDMAFNMRLPSAANEVAALEGKTGADVRIRARELLENQDSRVLKIARDAANEASLLGEENPLSNMYRGLRTTLNNFIPHSGDIVMPVVSVPAKVLHRGAVEYTPAGLLNPSRFKAFAGIVDFKEANYPELTKLQERIDSEDNPENKRLLELTREKTIENIKDELQSTVHIKAQNAQVKQLIGAGFGAYMVHLYMNGASTPPDSINYKTNAERKEGDAPPDSVLINGHWVSITKIPVLGLLASIYTTGAAMANMNEKPNYEDNAKLIENAVDSVIFSESPLKSLSDFTNAMEQRGGLKATEAYLGNFVASRIIPNAYAQIMKSSGEQFEVHSFKESLMARLGMNGNLQPKTSPYTGEQIIQRTLPLTNIKEQEQKPNPNIDELVKLGYTGLANPKPSIQGVALEPQEVTLLNVTHGHLMAHGMDYLFRGDGADEYQAASPEHKKELFKSMEAFVTKSATSIMLAKSEGLLERINNHFEGLPEDVNAKKHGDELKIQTPYTEEEDVEYSKFHK